MPKARDSEFAREVRSAIRKRLRGASTVRDYYARLALIAARHSRPEYGDWEARSMEEAQRART